MDDETWTEPVPLERPVARSRPLWPLVAALTVVVVALTVALVVVRAQDDRPHAAVGDTFAAPYSEGTLPHLGEVLLPWAHAQVGAGEPQAELPDLLGADANVQAPDGGSFVRVDVDVDLQDLIPVAAVATPFAQETEVVLRADGRDYLLSVPGGLEISPNGAYDQDGARWVAVDGEPSDLEVRITVDGVTQVVDASDGSVEAGQASDLAALPSVEDLQDTDKIRCGASRRLDTTRLTVAYKPAMRCWVQLALRTPYVDGIGWAATGREFLVVHAVLPRDLSLTTGRGDATTYWDNDLRIEARLGDAEPLAPAVDVNTLNQGVLSIQDADDPVQVIFDVAAGEPVADLTLRLLADARLGEPFVTKRQTMRFEWTVPVGVTA